MRTLMSRAMLALGLVALAGCVTPPSGRSSSSDCQTIVEDNRQLREALTRAAKALESDQTTFQALDKSLKSSSQEIVKLREELSLYRNILAPPDRKSGLRVQSLEVQPAGTNNLYSYRLLLVQSMKHEITIQGSVSFQIAGVKDGIESITTFPRANERAIQVKLKYFQEIDGKFELPRGFQPRTVKVHIVDQEKAQTVERTFEWPRI